MDRASGCFIKLRAIVPTIRLSGNKKAAPPDFNKYIFWDIDYEKINFEKQKLFVIERVLVMGDETDERKLFNYYKIRDIKKAAKKSTLLNDMTISYLSVILNIPEEKFKCYGKKRYYRNY
jgi:hypothetical protein